MAPVPVGAIILWTARSARTRPRTRFPAMPRLNAGEPGRVAGHPLTVSPVSRVTLPQKMASCSAGLSPISSRFAIVARM